MDEIKDIAEYHKLYLRGVITKQELLKEYEKMVLVTSARVEKCMAGITDSIYSVAYNIPSELDEHAKQMISQLCIIQSDYNNWREQHKKYEK